MVEEQKDLANEINIIQIHPNVESVQFFFKLSNFHIVSNVCF